jgi:hypothetical protein
MLPAITPTSAGVTVPPEVWAQMQKLLATFGPPNHDIPPLAPAVALVVPQLISSTEPETQFKPSVSPSNDLYNEEEDLEVESARSLHPIKSINSTSPPCKNDSVNTCQNDCNDNIPSSIKANDSHNINMSARNCLITKLNEFNYSTGSE